MTNDEIPNDEKNDESRLSNDRSQDPGPTTPPYDLEERSARFGEAVIDLCKKVPLGPLTNRVVDQLIGAGTSIGANYCEADDAVSKKDFRHKISICKREARESKHFLRMLARAVPQHIDEARALWQEAKELHLIFAAIYRRTK